MITFAVDDVKPASEPLATSPLRARYAAKAIAHGGDPELAVIDHRDTHPLLAAVGIAFAQHRPLVLSPDAVWLTIAQGVAQHVRMNASALRSRLVRHDGKQRLTIQRGSLPRDAAEWASAIGSLRELLAGEIGDGRARVFECDFSTSSDVDRLASQVVLLDAYSPYFSYWMQCICGIPSITLLGTPEDWRHIRERIDVIAKLDLEFWCRSLRPIADQLVRAAAGDVDVAFWKRIYNPNDAYGGESITGWITRLWPYLRIGGTVDRRNHMLELPIDEPKQKTTGLFKKHTHYDGPGVSSDTVPATLSRATLRFVDHTTHTLGMVDLVAGVSAVVQDERGALRPISGWHIEPASVRMTDVIDRIVAEHDATPAVATDDQPRFVEGTPDVVELFSRLERASLFGGKWQLAAPTYVSFTPPFRGQVSRVARLAEGTSLCAATRGDETQWILCRVAEPKPNDMQCTALDPPAQIRVLAGTFASILDAALETGGDVSNLVVGTLAE